MFRQSNKKDLDQLKELLQQLTTVGEVDINAIDDKIFNNIYVACEGDIIMGCATIIIENKIIHNGGKVGHIEDVVVSNEYRGKGIGKLLIENCSSIAKEAGCYKVILDCDNKNVEFYEKCGYRKAGVCMRLDLM